MERELNLIKKVEINLVAQTIIFILSKLSLLMLDDQK